MIGYITLGTNDFSKAVEFYDTLLGEMGAKRVMEMEGAFVAWGTDAKSASLSITKPFDGKPATGGNGTMVALFVDSKDKVGTMHAKALTLGGSDEGAPGPRGDSGFYGAYFRDLDGNKLCFFTM